MASVELNAAEEHQHASELPSSEEDRSQVQSDTPDALNFSHLTPSTFGISVQSFTPSSSSNAKDKSRLAQLKARRRSSIGVRGSPETNSLIRFLAQQRWKTPPAPQTTQLALRNSPLLPRCASSLRQKLASFQSLMEESEVCGPTSERGGNAGGRIKTRDYLSDGGSLDDEKENSPALPKPPGTKRRRVAPLRGCEVEIREAGTPTLHVGLKEQEAEAGTPQASDETREEARALLLSGSDSDPETPPPLVVLQPPGSRGLQACTPTKHQQGPSVLELQTLAQRQADEPGAAPPSRPSSTFLIPSLLEMKSSEDDVSTGTSTVRRKKKQVHFGGPLSPELFDKNLPPSTPLQRGSTPARAATPGGALGLRSALKTPQRSPWAQPDLGSPSAFGASPTFAMPRSRRMLPSADEDVEETYGVIAFPSMEDVDSDVASEMIPPSEAACSTELMSLNTTFHLEAPPESPTDVPAEPEAIVGLPHSQMDAVDQSEPLPETQIQPDVAPEAPGRPSTRNRKSGPERESPAKAPARCSSRKRKQPEDSEASGPVKRSTRSAAVSASGRMKTPSKAARRWNKEVDRSLYGSRIYASKNPALSPITESLAVISQPPAPPSPSHADAAAQHQLNLPAVDDPIGSDAISGPTTEEDLPNGDSKATDHTQEMGNVAATDAQEAPSEPCVSSPSSDRGSTGGRRRGRRLKRRDSATTRKEVRARGRKLSKDPQAQQETEQETAESLEDQAAEREETKRRIVPDDDGICIAGVGELRSSQESGRCSRSDLHGEERSGCSGDLAPWQADFNFEDVFKPITTRGQRSVRRSLRNHSSVEQSEGGSDNSSGLAWLPWTSPESSREARRRTRGRRLEEEGTPH